jgi:hypothetical protein
MASALALLDRFPMRDVRLAELRETAEFLLERDF